jgi:hypothetical protein
LTLNRNRLSGSQAALTRPSRVKTGSLNARRRLEWLWSAPAHDGGMNAFFKDSAMQFATENALGESCFHATDAGEVLATTAAEGADGHCEPLAAGLRAKRILDWLDEQVPA